MILFLRNKLLLRVPCKYKLNTLKTLDEYFRALGQNIALFTSGIVMLIVILDVIPGYKDIIPGECFANTHLIQVS